MKNYDIIDSRLNRLTEKMRRLNNFRPLPSALVNNLEEWFNIELTYNSNAIEGNTLTRKETALVVETGITIRGKTLREHLEAVNHAESLEFIKSLVSKKRDKITTKDVLEIHSLILSKIDDENAGRYRTVTARIRGTNVVLPNPVKVPKLMDGFFDWLHAKNTDHTVKFAADAHFKLVSIHPFTDGNGRSARLLMNLLLMQKGYPPALIRKDDREAYINSIEKGQLSGNFDDYYLLICKSVERSLDIYLNAVEGKGPRVTTVEKRLLKIGELTKETQETLHTIRHWTKKGLLEVAERTEKGYQLFNRRMIEQAQQIRKLQKKGLSLDKIKLKIEYKS